MQNNQLPAFDAVPYYNYDQRARDRDRDLNQRFTALRPEWYDNFQITRRVAEFSRGTSFFTGGLAVACFFYMRGNPQFILNAVRGLGLTTVISGFTSYFLFKRDCWKDPEYRIEQGRNAELEIVSKNLTVRQIEQNYRQLRQYDLLTNEDLNRLFRDRIKDETISFRYTLNLIIDSTDFEFQLDEENKAALKHKLVEYLQEHDIDSALTADERRFLNLNDNELDLLLCFPALDKLKENHISYSDFLRKAPIFRWRAFSAENLAVIKGFAIPYFINENMGTKDVLQRADGIILNVSLPELVAAGALIKDLNQLQSELIGYADFRIKHGTESYPLIGNLNSLSNAFCKSYKVARQFSEDAELFGFEREMLLQSQFEKEIAHIKSFSELIDKMGVTVFSDRRITKEDPLLQKWIKAHLTTYHIPFKSPLIEYDLLSAGVSNNVKKALDLEGKAVQNNNGRKEQLQAKKKGDIENARAQYNKSELDVWLRGAKTDVATYQGKLGNLEQKIKQMLDSVGESAALALDLRYHEPIETLLLKKQRIEISIEEKNKLKAQVAYREVKGKIDELEGVIALKESEITKLTNEEVTGYTEASQKKSEANAIGKEVKKLKADKADLEKKIKGVKPLSWEQQREAEERLRGMDGLELDLEKAAKALEEARKAKASREKFEQLPTKREIKANLDELYREKSDVEIKLGNARENLQRYQSQIDENDRQLKAALERIDNCHLVEMTKLEEQLGNEKANILRGFIERL